MKNFEKENNIDPLDLCTQLMAEAVPQAMRQFRADIRRLCPQNLSLTQFRTLGFVRFHDGASLADVTDHLGLSPSTASKLIDGLVQQQFISRESASDDRRRIILCLTESGVETLQQVYDMVRAQLTIRLAHLTADEVDTIIQAMTILQQLFTPEHYARRQQAVASPITAQ